MSVELDVIITRPLLFEEVIGAVKSSLADLLCVTEIPDLLVEVMFNGTVLSTLPQFVNEDTGLVFISLNRIHSIYFSVLKMPTEQDLEKKTVIATITCKGAPEEKIVIGIACAIAIAKMSQSLVENNGTLWGKRFEYEPDNLLAMLECKKRRNVSEESFAEVLRNIRNQRES